MIGNEEWGGGRTDLAVVKSEEEGVMLRTGMVVTGFGTTKVSGVYINVLIMYAFMTPREHMSDPLN